MLSSVLRRVTATFALIAAISMIASPVAAATSGDYDPVKLLNLTIAHRLVADVFNDEDAARAAALVSNDAVLSSPYGDYVGPEGVLDYVALVKRSYPDAEFEITGIQTRGDSVVVEWTMRASRFQIDPVEQPLEAGVTVTGELTVSITDTQIVGMTQVNETIAVVTPGDLVLASVSQA